MVEPRIQYAKTSDGVSIAYATAGSGPSLLCVPLIGQTHAQRLWKLPWAIQPLLAETFRVTWYDSRGSGLSQRDALDFSLDAMMLDAEAVVERAGLGRFALFAEMDAVPVAIRYAASHPERLSHLILWNGWARHSDYPQSGVVEIEKTLREKDWVLFTDTFGRVLAGFDDPALGDMYADYLRACATAEGYRIKEEAIAQWDVRDHLPCVTAPTLVVHSIRNAWLPVDTGQRIAAAIPEASLTLLDGFTKKLAPIVAEFCGAEAREEPALAGAHELPSGTAVILFADIANSTALTERLGDSAFRAMARELDGALRERIHDAGGTAIEGKLLGDGVLAVFTSARQAIECALACNAASADAELPLHLGIHAGDVIREDNNVYGGAVNIAARIADTGAPGEVLVSQTVRDLARTSASVAFEDRGEYELKGVSDPQRLFAVQPATD